MSDAEEEQYDTQSFARSGEVREEEEEYGGSRHGSSRKHNQDRRRRDDEEEEEEEADEEEEEGDEDDEDEDDDGEEGVARGGKRQKVCSHTIQHAWSILNAKVFAIVSVDTNALPLTASLMLKLRSMRTKTRKKRMRSMVEVSLASFYDSFTSHSNAIALQTSSSPNMKAMVMTKRLRGDQFTMPALIDAKGSSTTKTWHA
jgi:hypothetical protein